MSQYQCASCSFASNNLHDYARHIRDQHGQRVLFQCSICSKQFGEEADLTMHLETHASSASTELEAPTSPYQCKQCNKSFLSAGALVVHEGSHDLETPLSHTCSDCGYKAIGQRSLDIHMRKHTGEGPHKCKECGMGFQQISHLKTHSRTQHSTAKPFKCEHCDYTAAIKSTISTHMRKVHKTPLNQNVKCTQPGCDFMTSSHGNLSRHTAMKHPRKILVDAGPTLNNAFRGKSMDAARKGKGRGRGGFTGKTQNGTVTPFKVTFKDSSGLSQKIMIEGDLTINIDWDSREFGLESKAPLQAA